MRILQVIPWLAARYGGPVPYVLELSDALERIGHSVTIACTDIDGPGRLRVELGVPMRWRGANAIFHGVSRPKSYLTSWSMLKYLRQNVAHFDLIHVHALYRFHSPVAAQMARFKHTPYVVQAHGTLDPWHRARRARAKSIYHRLIEDRVLAGASYIVCTSNREEEGIQRLGYVTPTKVIPIGIAASELRVVEPWGWLERSGLPRAGRRVVFLGRISAKKGVPILVEAFRQIALQHAESHLVIAGPDDEGIGRGLAASITATGLGKRVFFTGLLSFGEKRQLLQSADVFVLPSADESFGVAVAEAMAVGCPVVVSPEVAIESLIRESGAGIVCARDPASVAQAVTRVLGDPTAAAAMGLAGRTVVDSRLSWPTIARAVAEMYQAALAAGR